MAYVFALSGALGCPPCSISSGGQCVPCPDESDLPECDGCVGGRPQEVAVAWHERSKWIYPTVLTVVGALATGITMAYVAKRVKMQS